MLKCRVQEFASQDSYSTTFEARLVCGAIQKVSNDHLKEDTVYDIKEHIRRSLEISINKEIFGELKNTLRKRLLKGFKETEIERNYIYHDMMQLLDEVFEQCKVVVE